MDKEALEKRNEVQKQIIKDMRDAMVDAAESAANKHGNEVLIKHNIYFSALFLLVAAELHTAGVAEVIDDITKVAYSEGDETLLGAGKEALTKDLISYFNKLNAEFDLGMVAIKAG